MSINQILTIKLIILWVMLLCLPTKLIADVSTYAGLRSLNGSTEDSVTITTNPIQGTFNFSSIDEHGFGDDNGITIASPNGWWIRQFDHSQKQPIQLDWFMLKADDEITSLLIDLANTFSPFLYLKMPSTPLELYLDYINLSNTTKFLHILRGHPSIKIRQKERASNIGTILRLDDYKQVVIQSGITFVGRYDLFGSKKSYEDVGLLRFNLNKENADIFDVQADIVNSPNFGINHTGGTNNSSSNRVLNATIGGRYYNSGARLNSGIENIHFKDLHILDPLGKGAGWNESLKIANRIYFEKHHGAWIQYAKTITGKILLEYGSARWFMAANKYIGNSKADPFIIEDRQLGWLPNGQEIPSRNIGMRTQTGKIDGLYHPVEKNRRFLKLISDGKNRLQYPFVIEATPEHKRDYFSENIHIELVNITAKRFGKIGEIRKNNHGAIGHTKGNILTGEVDGLIILDADNTCEKLTFDEIIIQRNSKQRDTRPDNFLLSNSLMRADGKIVIKSGQNLEIKDLLIEGLSRTIISIQNKTEVDIVSLDINNIKAPKGSIILADKPDLAKVSIDGKHVSLPYVIQ